MLSAFLIEPGKIELRQIERPEPAKGQLLVKVNAALTCGTDLKAFLRGHPLIPLPGPFGHEFSGVVAEVGKFAGGRAPFKAGDAIMAVHTAPCLKCGYCKKGLYNLCENIMGTKALGAFSEYILLPEHIVRQNTFRKPPGLSFKKAGFLEPLSCVVHGMDGLGIKKGDRTLVIGGGPIGLLHLILLKKKGAVVALTDIHDERLKKAGKLGADFTFKPEMTEELTKDITSGMGFDYVFECTGLPQVWEAAINCVRRGGTVILFGGCPTGTRVSYDTARLHYDELTLKGVFHFTPEDVKEAYKLITGGRLGLSRLISGTFPLRQIGEAFDKLKNGIGVKYAILP